MLRNPGLRKSVEQPVLDLNFAAAQIGSNAAPDSRIDFSRGSNAWFVDTDGLVKKSPHNLHTYSEQFDNAYWIKAAGSIAANAIAAPDGTLTADLFTEDTANTTHNLGVNLGFNYVSGTTYASSVYVKANGRTKLQLNWRSNWFPNAVNVDFDLNAETASLGAGAVFGKIENVGNGWFRLTAMATADATGSSASDLYINIQNDSGDNSYTGDGSSGVYLWGAQLSQHYVLPVDNPYIKTTGSAVYAARLDHDPAWFMSAAQEQNLFQYSEMLDNSGWTKTRASVTANATTAPDGTTTAEKLFLDSTNSTSHFAIQNTEILPGVKHTFSVYLKADALTHAHVSLLNNTAPFEAIRIAIDLSDGSTNSLVVGNGASSGSFNVTDAGNGWYRVEVSGIIGSSNRAWGVVYLAESASTFVVATGDGSSGLFVWGAQLEVGSTASTYHRTTGAPYYGPGATPKGLLIEEQRANLLTDSDVDPWFDGTRVTITTGAALAPDGTTTAEKVAKTAASFRYVSDGFTPASTGDFTASGYLKAGSLDEVTVLLTSDAGATLNGFVIFNLTNETSTDISSSALVSKTLTDVGNGWYRFTIAATFSNTTNPRVFVYPGIYNQSVAGDIFVWGFQVEAGSFATSFIQTTGSTATRNADVAVMGPTTGGTELVTNGTFDTDTTGWNDFGGNRSSLSVSSGQLVVDVTNANFGFVAGTDVDGGYDPVVVPGRRYRLSADLKVNSGNGVEIDVYGSGSPIAATGVVTSGTLTTKTVDFTCPDGVTSVTLFVDNIAPRATTDEYVIDNVSLRELYPFEQYNPAEGTMFVEATQTGEGDNFASVVAVVQEGSHNNDFINIYRSKSNDRIQFSVKSGGTLSADRGFTEGRSLGTAYKFAGSYLENSLSVSLDGLTRSDDTSVTIPAVDQLLFYGDVNFQGNEHSGYIKRFRYYKRKLDKVTLQSLTSD